MSMAELQMAATQRICSGELSERDLQDIINAKGAIVCSVDVYRDGSVKPHVTKEDEVLDFACRCDSYEELKAAMDSRRQEYQGQVARAKIARDSKQQKLSN